MSGVIFFSSCSSTKLIPDGEYLYNKSKIELDEDNFSTYTDQFLTNKNIKGFIKYYYLYDAKYNNLGFSKIDFIFNHLNKQHTIQTSLDSLLILDGDYIIKVDTLSSLQLEAFKYKNGDYFFYLSQQSNDYTGDFIPIYHIDTINWKKD